MTITELAQTLPPNIVQTQARTPAAGVALINGTQALCSYAVPNDGQLHEVYASAGSNTTVAQTGGAVNVAYTLLGQAVTTALVTGNQAVGTRSAGATVIADPGTTVTVQQNSALTAGAATVVAAISGG